MVVVTVAGLAMGTISGTGTMLLATSICLYHLRTPRCRPVVSAGVGSTAETLVQGACGQSTIGKLPARMWHTWILSSPVPWEEIKVAARPFYLLLKYAANFGLRGKGEDRSRDNMRDGDRKSCLSLLESRHMVNGQESIFGLCQGCAERCPNAGHLGQEPPVKVTYAHKMPTPFTSPDSGNSLKGWDGHRGHAGDGICPRAFRAGMVITQFSPNGIFKYSNRPFGVMIAGFEYPINWPVPADVQWLSNSTWKSYELLKKKSLRLRICSRGEILYTVVAGFSL